MQIYLPFILKLFWCKNINIYDKTYESLVTFLYLTIRVLAARDRDKASRLSVC